MKKRIVVLMGGFSNEREISLFTGDNIYKAINSIEDYDVIKYDLVDIGSFIEFISKNKDITIFNALHGKFGEDGRIQAILDLYKIPYTHSGVLASSVCMNKLISKTIAQNLKIPVAKHQVVQAFDLKHIDVEFPFIIKPIDEGSSVGIYIINSKEELSKAYYLLQNFNFVMVEEYISGIECTVGVLQGKALGVTEIEFNSKFYDYKAKYLSGGSEHYIPPKNITDAVCGHIKNFSEMLYKTIGTRGAIRVDFIVRNNIPIFLEINNQPGMTKTSHLPEQAKYKGISFTDLCISLINVAKFDN